MKLKCLTDICEYTTKGKEYPVKEIESVGYIITVDDGEDCIVYKRFIGEFFEEVQE